MIIFDSSWESSKYIFNMRLVISKDAINISCHFICSEYLSLQVLLSYAYVLMVYNNYLKLQIAMDR